MPNSANIKAIVFYDVIININIIGTTLNSGMFGFIFNRQPLFIFFAILVIFLIFAVTQRFGMILADWFDQDILVDNVLLRAGLAIPGDVKISSSVDLSDTEKSLAPVLVFREGDLVKLSIQGVFADEVLFYTNGGALPADFYLGKALGGNDGNWNYELDLSHQPLPNGWYRLYAQITKGGNIYKSDYSELEIDDFAAVNNSQTEAIRKTVTDSKTEIIENDKNIALAVQNAIISLIDIAGSGMKSQIQENVLLFSSLTRRIEQSDYILTKKILERRDNSTAMRDLEEEIAGFPENIIDLISSEKISELKLLKEAVRQLDIEIPALQSEVESIRKSRQSIIGQLWATSPEAARIFDKLEAAISKEELDTIAKNELLRKDDDRDGLANEDEIGVMSDPLIPDSDGDGLFDGDEVKNGYDPLKSNEGGKLNYDNPQITLPKFANIYKIDQILPADLPEGGTGILLEGSALPNSYAQIFIYSLPLVSLVKVDSQGHWSYRLDKPLSDGRHTAYITQINSQGEITARSEIAIFKKSGNSVFRITTEEKRPSTVSVNDLKNNFSNYAISLVILAFALAFFAIGFITSNIKKGAKDSSNAR